MIPQTVDNHYIIIHSLQAIKAVSHYSDHRAYIIIGPSLPVTFESRCYRPCAWETFGFHRFGFPKILETRNVILDKFKRGGIERIVTPIQRIFLNWGFCRGFTPSMRSSPSLYCTQALPRLSQSRHSRLLSFRIPDNLFLRQVFNNIALQIYLEMRLPTKNVSSFCPFALEFSAHSQACATIGLGIFLASTCRRLSAQQSHRCRHQLRASVRGTAQGLGENDPDRAATGLRANLGKAAKRAELIDIFKPIRVTRTSQRNSEASSHRPWVGRILQFELSVGNAIRGNEAKDKTPPK